MTLAFNVAFSETPALTWDQFKTEKLFPITTEQIYTGTTKPYNTSGLRNFLEGICNDVGYNILTDLRLDSAILIAGVYGLQTYTYWLTNIAKVAEKLPEGTLVVGQNIKTHQLQLEVLSSLLCSAAIPSYFPKQELYYIDATGRKPIVNRAGENAKFLDGGTGGIFSNFIKFFQTYDQKFDNIYFISPNFAKTEEEAVQLLSTGRANLSSNDEDALFFMDSGTKKFIKEIKAFNVTKTLANNIYYCKPEVTDHSPLDFSQEELQYTQTIDWGKTNPTKIAIDISTIPDSEL